MWLCKADTRVAICRGLTLVLKMAFASSIHLACPRENFMKWLIPIVLGLLLTVLAAAQDKPPTAGQFDETAKLAARHATEDWSGSRRIRLKMARGASSTHSPLPASPV